MNEEKNNKLLVPKNVSKYKEYMPGFGIRELKYALPITIVFIFIGMVLSLFLPKMVIPLALILSPVLAYVMTVRSLNGQSFVSEIQCYIEFAKSEKRVYYRNKK